MFKFVRPRSFVVQIFASLIIALTSLPISAVQQPKAIPPAPVPSQIFTAKKVFISNARGRTVGWSKLNGMPDRPYNQFYAVMKAWGRYELVTSPIDADLVFEIRFDSPVGPSEFSLGTGGSVDEPQFNLVIYDAKTHFSLWWFTELFEYKYRRSKDMQFDAAMDAMVIDIKKLVATPSPSAPTPTIH
ncbi:MAG TPA: hypothetical protein VFC63_24350 [Blastocatellia bacterium]|nr:hypothetical protein [Blastocatellia bacterium]